MTWQPIGTAPAYWLVCPSCSYAIAMTEQGRGLRDYKCPRCWLYRISEFAPAGPLPEPPAE